VLILTHFGVGFRVIKVGVGVEYAQHARNCAVVDGASAFVALDGLGVVLFDDGIDIRERFQAVAELALILRGLRADTAFPCFMCTESCSTAATRLFFARA